MIAPWNSTVLARSLWRQNPPKPGWFRPKRDNRSQNRNRRETTEKRMNGPRKAACRKDRREPIDGTRIANNDGTGSLRRADFLRGGGEMPPKRRAEKHFRRESKKKGRAFARPSPTGRYEATRANSIAASQIYLYPRPGFLNRKHAAYAASPPCSMRMAPHRCWPTTEGWLGGSPIPAGVCGRSGFLRSQIRGRPRRAWNGATPRGRRGKPGLRRIPHRAAPAPDAESLR